MAEKSLVSDQKPQVTFSLVAGVSMAVCGSAFQYGYNVAVMNAPKEEIQDFFFNCNETENLQGSSTDCSEAYQLYRDNMYAVAVSAFAFAGMVGAFTVGPVVNKFGRRGGLMFNNILSVIAAACLALSKYVNSFELIVVGRIFIGLFSGLETGIVPMYITEIAPKEWRGAIGVLHQLLITIGILVAQIFGLGSILGNSHNWPFLFALTCVPSLIQTLSYPLMPRSPRYLLIDLHQEDQARNELVKLRGTGDVSAEIDEMRAEAEEQSNTKVLSISQLLHEKSIRWQLITILAMMVAQQLSGINAVFFYTNTIFSKAGIPEGNPQDMASIAVGAVNVLMTIISVGVIEKVGRKKLVVWGFGTMIFWCLVLTIILNILVSVDMTEMTWLPYLSIGCVIGYIIGFAIGPGPIPWILTGEMFTQEARPPAAMLACGVNWICNFMIGIGFPAVAVSLFFN